MPQTLVNVPSIIFWLILISWNLNGPDHDVITTLLGGVTDKNLHNSDCYLPTKVYRDYMDRFMMFYSTGNQGKLLISLDNCLTSKKEASHLTGVGVTTHASLMHSSSSSILADPPRSILLLRPKLIYHLEAVHLTVVIFVVHQHKWIFLDFKSLTNCLEQRETAYSQMHSMGFWIHHLPHMALKYILFESSC